MFFARLALIIADEVAIKQTLESKGASGKLFCSKCSNVVSKQSFDSAASTEGMVRSTCTDFDQFRLHTNQSVMAIVKYLEEKATALTPVEFAKLETALGFNWRPGGLLKHPQYGSEVSEMIMFDWFHIFAVHGLANRELGLLHDELTKAGMVEGRLDAFIKAFKWPKQFEGSRPSQLFGKKDKGDPLKCGASELLSSVPVIRLFILKVAWEQFPNVRPSMVCCLKLFQVLDLLIGLNRGVACSPDELQVSIKDYLNEVLKTYGDTYWVPKCHMALHLHDSLKKHKTLLSCFVQERKHRIIKRFGGPICNFNQSFEKGILTDVLHVQLEELEHDKWTLNAHLCQERLASIELASLIRSLALASAHQDIYTSNTAMTSTGIEIHQHDVVEHHVGQVGQVRYHVRHGHELLTVLNAWSYVHASMYKVQDEPIIIHLEEVRSVCVYSIRNDNAMVARR